MEWSVLEGDCRDVMAGLESDSVDAIVSDPPYGLSFMSAGWDHDVPGPAYWAEALRVAKPGAHLVAFGGTRTFHRLTCAIEDAGWEIRDCLSWLYGQGFPKSLDVSKAIDKAAGAEREVVGSKAGMPGYSLAPSQGNAVYGGGIGGSGDPVRESEITAPATVAARQWQGWGTALKPAWEPIVLARKPLVGTVAANVQAHGTGAINVDGCRIEGAKGWPASRRYSPGHLAGTLGKVVGETISTPEPSDGRWPANVALDEHAAAVLDEQSGFTAPKPGRVGRMGGHRDGLGMGRGGDAIGAWPADPGGGASRFFYVAKASTRERNAGVDDANRHPTVKPIALMRWLCRLVTPPGGLVLDPFCGSGTTGCASVLEGFRFVGIERESAFAELARQRITHWAGHERQAGLFDAAE